MPSALMPNELRLAIGGMGILLRWRGSHIADWSHRFYQDFVSSNRPEVTLDVHCGDLPDCREEELLFDGVENHWRLYGSNGCCVIETFDRRSREKCQVALMTPDFSSGDVHVRPNDKRDSVWSLANVMQPLGELLVVNRLSRRQGLLIHGSAIDDRGKGLAFIGPSGSGKTTMVRLWRRRKHVTVLNDERIILRKHDDGFWAYGTPWPGMISDLSSGGVPLTKVFLISHANENSIIPARATSLVSDLLSQAFLPFWDGTALATSLAFCEELIEGVRCHRLGFVKDRQVVEFIRGLDEN